MNVQARDIEGQRGAVKLSPRVIVIGAGMSGVLMGIKLKEAGINSFTIFEKASRIGGTWRENTYPGIACDVPAHHYCYSFEPNPDWSRRHPPGTEIWAYLENVAKKYAVVPHIRFNEEIESAKWQNGAWRVRTKKGEDLVADIVVSATGVLHHPSYPDIKGLNTFKGAMFHTARWDQSIELKGKRVGIIGNGSTAAQIVPAIIDKVGKLSLFQRTPQWMIPLDDKVYSESERRWFHRLPILMKFLYQWYYRLLEIGFSKAVAGDKAGLVRLEKACRDNLANVKDPELRRKLTPDYKPGCKRLIFSTDFYTAIQKPNADLVTEAIDHIEEKGVVTKDGKLHELDVLVLSTGFKADAFMRPMEITGENGVTLAQVWAKGPTSYRAVTIPHLPNFFTLIGPYSPIGNLSLISISEWQARYIMKCIDEIRARNVAIAPREDVTERRLREMHEAAKNTVWVTGCKSWYLDKDGNPGLYPWPPSRFYKEMSHDPDMNDFAVVPLPQPVGAAV